MQVVHHRFRRVQLGMSHGEGHGQAVPEGGCRAHRHQRIHIGRAVPQRLEAADKEFLVDDHHDGRQHHFHNGDGQGVLRQHLRQRPPPHHVAHGNVHQHQQEAQRPHKPPAQHGRIMVGQRITRRLLCLGFSALDGRAVACLGHRADHLRFAGRTLHAHGVGQQRHGYPRHARHLADGLLHSRRAGRTGHTGHIVLLHHSYNLLSA